jgi:thiamine-monophosphate kinase
MRLKDIGEREVVSYIRKYFPAGTAQVPVGIGDDAAAVRSPSGILLTNDLLVEDHDFLMGLHPPRLLGRKSLNVNLSDIAAMGGSPLYAVLGMGLPGETDFGWLKEFLAGFRSAARDGGAVLVGGDLSEAGSVLISVTVVGKGKAVVRRKGARPGDSVFVSGTLGDAAEGLRLVKEGFQPKKGQAENHLLKAFLDPSPRLTLGSALAGTSLASAMIDVSDGLAADLAHICEESGVGAEIETGKLPLSKALRRLSRDPLASALYGGEDFELLFTVRPKSLSRLRRLEKRFRLTRIGRIVKGKGILAVDSEGAKTGLKAGGFEHFRSAPVT